MIKENMAAPAFSLPGSDGKIHSAGEFRGKYLVLYFYPKDDTPGCTIEAKNFNKNLKKLEKLGAKIVGVSADDLDSHGQFISKYLLDFLLLSDPKRKVIKKYDALVNRGIFGTATLRKTYIIGKDGKILKAYDNVKPETHIDEVIKFISSQK